MDAKELKLGNYVGISGYPADGLTVLQIKSMDPKRVGLSDGNYYKYDELYKLDLTEEWLVRAGFELAKDPADSEVKFFRKGKRCSIVYNAQNDGNYRFHFNEDPLVWLDYVHQLQNLWFALKNKALKFHPQ